jgi:hypothetical protein
VDGKGLTKAEPCVPEADPSSGGRGSEAEPLMTLQWLQVRVKPDHCREIRPRAHRPPWDDAGAEA